MACGNQSNSSKLCSLNLGDTKLNVEVETLKNKLFQVPLNYVLQQALESCKSSADHGCDILHDYVSQRLVFIWTGISNIKSYLALDIVLFVILCS